MLNKYQKAIAELTLQVNKGKVLQCIGLVVEASCPNVFVGELCDIYPVSAIKPIKAEVVGFRGDRVLLMPYEKITGLTLGSPVVACGKVADIPVGIEMLGRVIDAFGEPLDNKGAIDYQTSMPLYREPINPLTRKATDQPISTGIKAIDNFITIGLGQRIGLFAGSGVGKSTLLANICNSVSGDINVIVLVGERGREVEEFVNETLGPEGLNNSIVIAATAEQSPLARTHSVYAGIAIAEYFSNLGKHVFFTVDSMTRFATATRDIGLAIGEPPTVSGYTASVFSALPNVVERCGSFRNKGDITAILTVLVESGDFDDPVVDALRAILDGHIVLTRELAERSHFPAIDVLKSVSRMFTKVTSEQHRAAVQEIKTKIAEYMENRELIEFGGYGEANAKTSDLLQSWSKIEAFLTQKNKDADDLVQSQVQLQQLAKGLSGQS